MVLGGLAFFALWALPEPDVILSISAQSETFEYRVIDSSAASIRMTNAVFINGSSDPFAASEPRLCLTGRLLPKPGVNIRYRRGRNGSVGIGFSSKNMTDALVANFEVEDGKIIRLFTTDQLLLNPHNETCPAKIPNTLPIRGQGSIGILRTFGSGLEMEPGDLIGGEVRVTAKAVERVFGISTKAQGLYDAGVVNLPSGSMLRSNKEDIDRENSNVLPWIGAARILNENGFSGFEINLSTDSDTVWLYRSGHGSVEGKPDAIGASAFVSQTRDPGIIRIQVLLALMLIIIQTVASVMQTAEAGKNPRKFDLIRFFAGLKSQKPKTQKKLKKTKRK